MVYKIVKKLAKWIRKLFEEKSPKFIVLKTYGIMNAPNSSMVASTTLYGETTVICPKCRSKNVHQVYTHMFWYYECKDCKYR